MDLNLMKEHYTKSRDSRNSTELSDFPRVSYLPLTFTLDSQTLTSIHTHHFTRGVVGQPSPDLNFRHRLYVKRYIPISFHFFLVCKDLLFTKLRSSIRCVKSLTPFSTKRYKYNDKLDTLLAYSTESVTDPLKDDLLRRDHLPPCPFRNMKGSMVIVE